MDGSAELLRRLAAGDESSLRAVLSAAPPADPALDRPTRALVQLAALLAVDAGTSSLRWAVEIASAAGVDDAALVRVLLTAASTTGTAQAVASAPRLALALDVDVELDGWDGT
jgi:alkylhydroperoxidase/carboxymuconolactone decarboxylase family protein YurZ